MQHRRRRSVGRAAAVAYRKHSPWLRRWAAGLLALTLIRASFGESLPIPEKTQWIASASAAQNERHEAALAIDGNFLTRWSSPPTDGHWLQIDLGQLATVAGARLSWETARADKYRLLSSRDGKNWHTCREIDEGHGLVDQLYFSPVVGRYWRIACDQRGTRWGNSLWEVDLLGTDAQPIVTSAAAHDDTSLAAVMDGDLQTEWRSSSDSDLTLTVNLRHSFDWSGVCIYWGDSSARTTRLEASDDGQEWQFVSNINQSQAGKYTLVLGQRHEAQFLRLSFSDPVAAGAPVVIREIELRGPRESVKMYPCPCAGESFPKTPPGGFGLTAQAHDSRVDLRWAPVSGQQVRGYNIYRADSEDGPFEKIHPDVHQLHVYSDFIGANDRTYFYRVTRLGAEGDESTPSHVLAATPRAMNDEQFLTSFQEATFRYFWDYVDPVSGLAREGFTHPCNTCTTGGTGFGMLNIMVAAERGFITRDQAALRLLTMVRFLQDKAIRYHGAWSHWLDCQTGQTMPFSGLADNGGDLVETAFLIQGMLTVRQYFDRDNSAEKELRERITRLWEEVEWDWYLRAPGNRRLYWHWSPDRHWEMNHKIVGFNECLITYLLAIASPTHPIPPECYYEGWVGDPLQYSDGKSYFGHVKPVGRSAADPLFFTHYSFLGLDPRRFTDRFCNYFENNRNTTLINRAYCIDNPGRHKGYGKLLWGLTASWNPDGYKVHAPDPSHDDGTITPTAAICAMSYTPEESMATLRHLYHDYGRRIWGPFGFHDAFNLDRDWVSPGYLAIDQGPMVPMIENYRTALCWKMFMSNPEIVSMLQKLSALRESAVDR